MEAKEGWVIDISSRNRRHYYKNGISLCGKAIVKHYFKNFDKEYTGNKFACDCVTCIKKQKELIEINKTLTN